MHRIVLAIGVAGAAACGGGGSDIDRTLVFADRTDAEIGRLISAASGSEMFQAQSQVDQYGDTFETDPCPAIAIDGNVATITGGCTTADGVEIVGSAVVTNPQGWDQIEGDFSLDTEWVLDGFGYVQTGFSQTFDGEMWRSSDYTSWDADITVDSFGAVVRSDIRYVCTQSSQSCRLSGSGVELVGIGGATVSGTVSVEDGSSEFTLRGVDTLTADITQGCVAWQIEGTDRQMICQP
jgi:hypothetical protein